jgi:protein-tyrosine phosphatase
MELPMKSKASYLNPIIFKSMIRGFVPIIAHPERYKFVQDDPNSLIPFINSGVLFQMNYGSVIGFYGKEVSKTAAVLLKNDMIHFFGTDAHKKNSIYVKMDHILKTIRKFIDEDTLENLSLKNPQIVFENGNVKANKPSEYKKSFFLIFANT